MLPPRENLLVKTCKDGDCPMEKRDGTLKVLDSQIIFTPAAGEGVDPLLLPVPGLNIYVNEKLLQNPTPIQSGDSLKLVSQVETIENSVMDVKVSDDRLFAFLLLKPRIVSRWRVLDTPDTTRMKPPVEKEVYEEQDFNLEQVYHHLDKKGVVYGLDHQAIGKAFSLKNGEWTVIARGYAAVSGEDARLEIFFESTRATLDAENILENINYRDKGAIPCVDAEILLARKIPATPGKPGKTVTGQDLYPRSVKDFYLKAGKNTSITADGLEVSAAALGQPILEQKPKMYTVAVEPLYVLNDDVDLNSGNIRFRGDIQINGKVSESMEVHSEQNVEIKGSVNSAVIKAEGSVVIRDNVINSRILAGSRQFYGFQVNPHLLEFEATLIDILKAYQQIKANPNYATARFGYILDLLVEKKYGTFPKQIEKFYQSLEYDSQVDFSEEMINSIISLRKQLQDFKRIPYQEIKDAVHLLQTTQSLKNFLNLSAANQSNIHVIYCLNSSLVSSGSVTVGDRGCFHTTITAHDSIEIKGIVRGGTIQAGKNITLNEVGSEAAVKTTVIAPPGQVISISKAYENTVVIIGEKTYKFSVPRSRVRISLNKGSDTLEVSTY